MKGFYDKAGEMFGGGNSGANKNLSSQPLNNKIPDVAFNSENLMNDKGTQQQADVIANASQQDFAQAPLYGEINVNQLSGETLISSSSKISEAQISPIKQEATMKAGSVGPLPEPAPTILPFPMPGSTAKTQPVASSQTGGVANSVPSIDAENKDNYLLVYSHSVYNVPMT